MYLSKLEIQGFKSFAKKAVLEFNRELTAIVGPNGSGKSNVTDAVRWVLGEQSLKLLRGKKSQDVIFAGSDKKSRLGFAEVSLYLDNSDGSAPIDYRDIVITRRIYRDGEGEYLINKNKVRLSDIQLLLAKASFGQRSYSIIGQGMIDSVLASTPAERKELFDEATGVRQYQIKKDQAINKLERSQSNLAQSGQLISEIEPRLRSLTRQVKKLERKEELQTNLKELQTNYYSQLVNEYKSQHYQLNKSLNNAEEEKKKLETEIEALQKNIDQEQIGDTSAQAFQKLQNEYQELSTEKNHLTQELAVIKGKIDLDLTKAGKTDIVWLQNKQDNLKIKLESVTQKISEQSQSREKLKHLLKTKTDEQDQIIDEFKNLQNKLLETQKKFSKQDNISIVKIKQHLNELYNNQHSFIEFLSKVEDLTDIDKLKNKAENLLNEIKSLTNKLDESGEDAGQEIFTLQEKLNNFLTTKDSLVNEIQDLKLKEEIAKQKLEQFKHEEEELKEELHKISAELTTSNSNGDETSLLLNTQKTEAEEKNNELNKKLNKLQSELDEFSRDQEKHKHEFIELQQNLRHKQLELNAQSTNNNEIKIDLAKVETKLEELEKEIIIEFTGEFIPQETKEKINSGEAMAEISRLKNQLAIIGGIYDEIIDEYKEVQDRFTFLSEQTIDMENAIASCNELIDELNEKITGQFETAFNKINEKFKHYFKILFNGGKANLILQKKEIIDQVEEKLNGNDTENDENNNTESSSAGENPEPKTTEPKTPLRPRSEASKIKKYEYGVEIQATPPGKKLKSLNMLSGGEKALTSIALVSAIIANNPSPFMILDEVDAALDESNSIRFAKIVEELSDKTQFICITHNRATMQEASILYGVTMGDDGISKLLSINLTEAEKVAS